LQQINAACLTNGRMPTQSKPRYQKMAEWYWKANDQSKATAAAEKAIEIAEKR